jgi:hypothetical protein
MRIDRARYNSSMARLRAMLRPGDTVTTVLRSVARSGMSRHIDVYVISENQPFWLSGHVAAVLGYRQARDGSLIVSGAGMDVGFSVVYDLGYAMWPNGFLCTGNRCRSNDHFNAPGREYVADVTRHANGGFALNQVWL